MYLYFSYEYNLSLILSHYDYVSIIMIHGTERLRIDAVVIFCFYEFV